MQNTGKMDVNAVIYGIVITVVITIICVLLVIFAPKSQNFFKKLVPLPHGIPSKYTFARVLERIHPDVLQKITNEWRESIFITSKEGEQIVLDGKKLRASRSGTEEKACYLVNAWASQKGCVVSQKRVSDKANETEAMSVIIDEIDLEGTTVSIDAIGCQKNLARKITQKKIELETNKLQLKLISDKNEMNTRNTYNQKNVSRKSVVNTTEQMNLAQKLYDQTVLQQKLGTASLTDVLLADNALRTAQQSYLTSIVEYLKADLELKRITGNIFK